MLKIYYEDGSTDLVQSLQDVDLTKTVVDQKVYGSSKSYPAHSRRIKEATQ